MCFPVNICENFKNIYFEEHLQKYYIMELPSALSGLSPQNFSPKNFLNFSLKNLLLENVLYFLEKVNFRKGIFRTLA